MNNLRPISLEIKIISPFGERIHPITGIKNFHDGVDIRCPVGTAVLAVADGEIVRRWIDINEYKNGLSETKSIVGGGLSLVLHSVINKAPYFFIYQHLSQVKVQEGEKVIKCKVIGVSGGNPEDQPNAGGSTGPHLHFGVWSPTIYKNRRGTDCLDPEKYLALEEKENEGIDS